MLYSGVSIALVTVLAAGCSFPGHDVSADDEPPPTDGAPGDRDAAPGTVDAAAALTPQAYMTEVITRECEKAFACEAEYPQGATAFAKEWSTSEATCVATDPDYQSRELIAASVIAGTITFDPVLAASCLASLTFPASCAEFFDDFHWPTICFDALLGHLADGATCTNDWECPFGSICTGTCTPA